LLTKLDSTLKSAEGGSCSPESNVNESPLHININASFCVQRWSSSYDDTPKPAKLYELTRVHQRNPPLVISSVIRHSIRHTLVRDQQ